MKDCSSRVEHPLPTHPSPTHGWTERNMERWGGGEHTQRQNNTSHPNPTVERPRSVTGKQGREVLYL